MTAIAIARRDSRKPAPAHIIKGGLNQQRAHIVTLSLDEIHTYADNPRKRANMMFAELKTSIRERGLDTVLQVTQRPGDDFYVIEAGGNTRLEILKELWQETKDTRFYEIEVMVKPWVDELHVLTAHLTENILRSEMCFYDRAQAIYRIKSQLEDNEGHTLKWAEFERRLDKLGLKHSHTQIVRMRFLLETLELYAPSKVLSEIGPHHIQRIQTGFKDLSAIDERFPAKYKKQIKNAFAKYGCNIDAILQRLSKALPDPKKSKSAPDQNPTTTKNGDGASEAKELLKKEPIKYLVSNSLPAKHPPLLKDSDETKDTYKKRAHIYRLQKVIELRAKLFEYTQNLLGDAVWVTDNAFGFGVSPSKSGRLIQDLIGQMSAYALGSQVLPIAVNDIYQVESEDFQAMLKILALSKEIIDLINCLKADNIIKDDIDSLSNEAIISIQNELDPTIQAEKEMIEQYIKHEATNTILFTLFPTLTSNEVVKLRENLGVQNNGGRPIKALPFEKASISRLYKTNKKLDERELYLKIAEEVELPLSTVWNTIKSLEFTD